MPESIDSMLIAKSDSEETILFNITLPLISNIKYLSGKLSPFNLILIVCSDGLG